MNEKIHILIVEDLETDAELIVRELTKANIPFTSRRVDTKDAFLAALNDFKPAIVLSDYSLPQFSGREALRLLKQNAVPAPFILITGSLTEEVAVQCMKDGAYDYILKASLKRLPSAVLNALENAKTIEQKAHAEVALVKSQERYRLIAENTRDLICMLDVEGNYTYVSPSYLEVLGYAPESLLGTNCFALIHPDDRKMAEQKTVQSAVDQKPERFELRVKDRDGNWKVFETLGNWIYDSHAGKPQGLMVSRDITQRKQAEDTLRESEERTRLILENALDAVVTINAEGFITGWNSQAELTFGWSAAEVFGKSLADSIIPPQYREAHAAGLKRFLLTGQGAVLNKRIEITACRRDGSEIPVELSVSPMRLGETFTFSAFIRDISDRKLSEERLRKSEEQLRMSQKLEAVGQLAGGVAHDFNNLLTVISGYSDLILSSVDQHDKNRSKIEEIKRAAQRAASLTRQLLAFSRKQVLQPKLFDLNTLVVDISKMLQRLIGENIEITTVFDQEAPINADPGQIEQLLMNLVVNARDAMPTGGRITVETSQITVDETYARTHVSVQPGAYVVLSVSDTGEGMDAETQKRIFEPFFTTKSPGKGTGLGLSTVYGIVKQSGGNIWVYSEPGQGTVFKVYLPMAIGKEATLQTSPTPKAVPRGTETVLVVEDEPQIRRLAFEYLDRCGYKVLLSSNGLEAIALIEHETRPIDLVVTDVVMPQMSGKELADRIAIMQPAAKVLFMSGYTNDAVVNHGVLQAGTWFIQKPFALDALARQVRAVLDGNDPRQSGAPFSQVRNGDALPSTEPSNVTT